MLFNQRKVVPDDDADSGDHIGCSLPVRSAAWISKLFKMRGGER
jgi:hypothetical protein